MMDMETSLMIRHFRHPPLDTGGPLSKRQILFSNWLLLGLDVPTLEHKYSKPFNRDMFNLPNKAGAESILHFLFNRLNPVMCKEEFRDCWPVQDKKTEALFSRVCNKWLRNIQKDEPDSRLPRINASLFLSPYGEKFYQLLFRFTNFVMQQTIKHECEVRSRDKMSCPQMSPHNAHLGEVMYDIQKCGVVQRRQKFLERIERSIAVSETWKSTASDLVRENRRLSKSIRDLEHHLRNEEQMSHEKRVASRSPSSSKKHPLSFEHELTSHQIKRTHRVQKVRDKWKKLDGFCNVDTPERQIMESLLDKALHKYEIDAADIPVKVPGLLLRECENEIYKRHVDNTYQGGKLNILSLVQLWNLSLHLYIERFHQDGVPDLEMESRHLREAVHTNQAQTSNATSFQKMLREEFMPLLKQSVCRLRERLDADENNSNTPQSGRTMPVGLGLFSSTPPVSFTPKDEDGVPTESLLQITPHQQAAMTPEAAESIANTVAQSSRKVAKSLFQGTPVYAPRLAMQGKLSHCERHDTSRIPLKEKHKSVTINSNNSASPWRQVYKMDTEASVHERDALSTSITLDAVCDVSSSHSTPRSLGKTTVQNSHISDVLSSTRSSSMSPSAAPTTSQLLQDLHTHEQPETEDGTQDRDVVQKTRSSVDYYVDEIVAQVLDNGQDEDRSLEDAFSSLHSKSRSPARMLYLPSRSVVLDEADLNHSHVSDEQNTTRVKNRSYLSKSTLKEDVDEIVSRVGNLLDIVDEKTRTLQDDLGQMTASELTDDKSLFVHTEKLRQELRESDASVKFDRKREKATSRTDAHRNSMQQGSQIGGFWHPDIPNVDFSSPGHSSRGTPDPKKHRHSAVGANLLSEEGARVIAQWTNSGRSMSLDMRSGVDDMRRSLGIWATRQSPGKSPAANIPELTDSSLLPDDISRPLQAVTPSPRKSPDVKVGAQLTTEIRRMWRESLDDDTSEKNLPSTSVGGTTPKTSMTSNSFTATSSEGKSAKPYSFEFSPDSKFTALEDVSADVLLSPDMWDDVPAEYNVLQSSVPRVMSELGPMDDPVNSKNHQYENIIESLAASSPSLPSEHVLPQTHPSLKTFTNNTALPPYADNFTSPNLTRSLPGFRHKDDSHISIPEQRLHAESVRLASVFDDLDLEEDVEDARAELLVSLDDSFVPLKDGLHLEGKSPARTLQPTLDIHPHSHSNHEELFASFQRMNAAGQPFRGTLEPKELVQHEELVDKDLMQSTSSAEERLMSVLEEKYVTGVNTSWSLLDDDLEDINLLVES